MEHFDAVVIGSGAGGAPIAQRLVQAGHSVLVLEKGPLLRTQQQHPFGRSDFKRDELFGSGPERLITHDVGNRGAPFFPSHVEPDLNDEPHVYRHGQGAQAEDRVTIEGYTAQVVGGGTQLYGAVSLRFTPTDFRLASFNAARNDLSAEDVAALGELRDWPIDYATLEPSYLEAERLVGINGSRAQQGKPFPSGEGYQRPLPPNPISAVVERGMDSKGMARYRTPLAVITEDHAPSGRQAGDPRSGYVNRYGDPMGYKSNTWVSLLAPIADRPECTLRCNCTVTHLEGQGAAIDAVVYRDDEGAERRVSGSVVVVACSAIESARLLQLSGAADPALGARLDQSGLLGRCFLTHCFGGAEVRLPERYDKSISLDSDWATDHCASESWIRAAGLWAGGAIYNNTSDQALPIALLRHEGSRDLDTTWSGILPRLLAEFAGIQGSDADPRPPPAGLPLGPAPGAGADPAWRRPLHGQTLREYFERDFGRRLSVSFMGNQLPLRDNRIELHGHVRDRWNRPAAYIRKNWHALDRRLMDRFADECRDVLVQGLQGSGIAHDPAHLDVGHGGVYQAPNAQARIANHILGGMRFGADPSDSVLDAQCRHHQIDNLYVTDGSFMPSSGSGNPTLTIQANAFRVADHLLTRL